MAIRNPVAVGTTVVVGVLVLYAILAQPEQSQFVGIVLNAVLTLALIWLYSEMSETQEQQREIISKQTELQDKTARMNQVPIIERGPIECEDDYLYLSLLNTGNGPAYDLCLKSVVYSDIDKIDSYSAEVPLTKNVNQGPEDFDQPLQMGNSLGPSEGKRNFKAIPKIGYVDPTGELSEGHFRTVIDDLTESQEKYHMKVEIFLTWEGLHGSDGELLLLTSPMTERDLSPRFSQIFHGRPRIIPNETMHSDPEL